MDHKRSFVRDKPGWRHCRQTKPLHEITPTTCSPCTAQASTAGLLQNRIRTSRIGSQNAQELTWHEELNSRIYLDFIDKKTFEIRQDDDKVVYKSLDEIADDLPDNSPRYVLLSYPLTLVRDHIPPIHSCSGRPLSPASFLKRSWYHIASQSLAGTACAHMYTSLSTSLRRQARHTSRLTLKLYV